MEAHNSTYKFTSPGWPNGYADNLHCAWLFTSPPGTHLVLQIFLMDLEETSECTADSFSVYDGNALQAVNTAKLLQKLCLSNSTFTTIKASNVMTVKFDTDFYLNKTGFSANVYRGESSSSGSVAFLKNSLIVFAVNLLLFLLIPLIFLIILCQRRLWRQIGRT